METAPLKPEELGLIIATVVGMLLSAWMVLHSTRRSVLANRIMKTVEVTMHCSERYNGLVSMKMKLDKERSSQTPGAPLDTDEASRLEEAQRHYQRAYWSLKNDQFDFWLYGVLDHDTFFDWTYSYAYRFFLEASRTERPVSASWNAWIENRDGQNQAGSNPQFVKFTRDLFDLAGKRAKDVGPNAHDLRLIVLDQIKLLEGTRKKPGFSRKWREKIWAGMDFDHFDGAMRRDIDGERSRA
jgi:hypothetical protein